MQLKVHVLESQREIVSFEPFLKVGSEFEQRRESGSRFHSLGAEAWNAREPITVLHRGSAKRPMAYLMNTGNEKEYKE